MEAAPHPWPALGVLLLRDGLVEKEELEALLEEQRDSRQHRISGWKLGETLVERGRVTTEQVARLVAEQYELPYLELDVEAIDLRMAARLPAELVDRFSALPVEMRDDGSLLVAVSDPGTVLFTDELRRALGMPLRFAVAAPDALAASISYVREHAPEESSFVASAWPSGTPSFDLIRTRADDAETERPKLSFAPPAADSWPPLGTLLVRDGLVSEDELETALAQQRLSSDKRLGEILVERGAVTRADVARVVAEQYELPYLDVAVSEIHDAVAGLLPLELATRYSAVPLKMQPDGSLLVAVADPTTVLDAGELFGELGSRLDFAVADPDVIEAALLRRRLHPLQTVPEEDVAPEVVGETAADVEDETEPAVELDVLAPETNGTHAESTDDLVEDDASEGDLPVADGEAADDGPTDDDVPSFELVQADPESETETEVEADFQLSSGELEKTDSAAEVDEFVVDGDEEVMATTVTEWEPDGEHAVEDADGDPSDFSPAPLSLVAPSDEPDASGDGSEAGSAADAQVVGSSEEAPELTHDEDAPPAADAPDESRSKRRERDEPEPRSVLGTLLQLGVPEHPDRGDEEAPSADLRTRGDHDATFDSAPAGLDHETADLVTSILERAREENAAAVTFAAREGHLAALARIEGELRELGVVGCDPYALVHDLGTRHELEVEALPTHVGALVTARLSSDVSAVAPPLALELSLADEEALRSVLQEPSGLVVVASRDSRSRLAGASLVLHELGERSRLAIALGHESRLEGVHEVDLAGGGERLEPAEAVLRALRAAPDVLVVDGESDERARQASLAAAGEALVVLGVPAAAGDEALRQLLPPGGDPSPLASALRAVLEVAVVRRTCLACRESYFPAAEELAALGLPAEEAGRRLLGRGRGCEACRHTGYDGTVPLVALVPIGPEQRRAVADGILAFADSTSRVRETALALCLDGVTTSAEVLRVTAGGSSSG